MEEKFLDAYGLARVNYDIDEKLSAFVPSSRTVNKKPLSDDIVLTASDFNAATMKILDDAVRASIEDGWDSGWPEIWNEPIVGIGRVGRMRL